MKREEIEAKRDELMNQLESDDNKSPDDEWLAGADAMIDLLFPEIEARKEADKEWSDLVAFQQGNIRKLRAQLAGARSALTATHAQMSYYHEEISVPTSWQDVHKQVKEALTALDQGPEEESCPHCKQGKLSPIKGNEPYDPDHLMCEECSSTFPEGEGDLEKELEKKCGKLD